MMDDAGAGLILIVTGGDGDSTAVYVLFTCCSWLEQFRIRPEELLVR